MQRVISNIFQSPYCQYCVFSEDCTVKMKIDAREETKPKNNNIVWKKPCCFNGMNAEDLLSGMDQILKEYDPPIPRSEYEDLAKLE